MLSLQEEVKQFQLKVRENDTQISELHKIVQGIQAEKIAVSEESNVSLSDKCGLQAQVQ